MARTPRELEGEARRVVTRPADSKTLDKDERKSGAAVSQPTQPRGDFDRSMSGVAQDDQSPETAVPENVDQDTGGVRPKTTGPLYRKISGR